MSRCTEIQFTTTHGLLADRYPVANYRRIISLNHGSNKLWLPNTTGLPTTEESFVVSTDFAERIANYFEQFYVKDPSRIRNCHIGAAAMTGAEIDLKWGDPSILAADIVESGRRTSDLDVGQWGAIGTPPLGSFHDAYEEYCEDEEQMHPDAEQSAYHSVVGLAPGIGIQTDSQQGPFSIIPHREILDYYRISTGKSVLSLYS